MASERVFKSVFRRSPKEKQVGSSDDSVINQTQPKVVSWPTSRSSTLPRGRSSINLGLAASKPIVTSAGSAFLNLATISKNGQTIGNDNNDEASQQSNNNNDDRNNNINNDNDNNDNSSNSNNDNIDNSSNRNGASNSESSIKSSSVMAKVNALFFSSAEKSNSSNVASSDGNVTVAGKLNIPVESEASLVVALPDVSKMRIPTWSEIVGNSKGQKSQKVLLLSPKHKHGNSDSSNNTQGLAQNVEAQSTNGTFKLSSSTSAFVTTRSELSGTSFTFQSKSKQAQTKTVTFNLPSNSAVTSDMEMGVTFAGQGQTESQKEENVDGMEAAAFPPGKSLFCLFIFII